MDWSIVRMTQLGIALIGFSQVGFSQTSVFAQEPTASQALTPQAETVVSTTPPAHFEEIGEKSAGANLLVPSVVTRPLFQHANYPDAWKAAQQSNRPILVFVSMPNCHYCVKMKDQVLQQPQVKELVSGSFETVLAGRYTHAALVEKLHVKWYPTIVLVGPNNKVLDVIEGYAEQTKFQQRLQTSLASLQKIDPSSQTR
jgi:hypothetical protein